MKTIYQIFLSLAILALTSCVTRTSIPTIEGYVYNEQHIPLSKVNICIGNKTCVQTDNKGYFLIKKETYKEFIQIGGEAPPIFYDLTISKELYSDTTITYMSKYGGGNPHLKVKYDNIILRQKQSNIL